jgi:hypothetical protein
MRRERNAYLVYIKTPGKIAGSFLTAAFCLRRQALEFFARPVIYGKISPSVFGEWYM